MRINRRSRLRPRDRASRAQLLELLLGPNGASVFKSEEDREKAWQDVQEKFSVAFLAQWHASGNIKDFQSIANQYCSDIVASRISSCLQVRQACRRHLDDLRRISDPEYPYSFDAAKANRVCQFIELLPHVKGAWAAKGERIQLEPWQIFILSAIFGWVKKSSGLRRFTLAYIEVPRKNAKSTLAAGIGNYMFACDGEYGSEVLSGATNEKQALEVFRPALQMMQRSPELRAVLGVIAGTGPGSKKMITRDDESRFMPVVGKPGDGASPHCGIVDEYHEHDSDTLFDTFRTGMGARQQPLELIITTSGDNLAGPCKLLRDDVCKILDGTFVRGEVFAIVYTIDEGDNWSDDASLVKANPNIDVSVYRENLVTDRNAALASARKQGVFQTKHLCVWVGANAAYFNLQAWKSLGDPTLKIEDFLGLPCVCSVDLSTKKDFTTRVMGFKKTVGGKDHYYFFVKFYLPEAEVMRPEAQHYQGWAKEGFLQVHRGAVIDFAQVKKETVEDIRRAKAREFRYDPWNAAEFAQAIGLETRATVVEVKQTVQLLSPPMKELDAKIAQGCVHHEGNPVANWMMGNIVGHEDANENVFPRKPDGREESKIDFGVAAIMTTGGLMVAAAKKSVYSTRGLYTLDQPAAGAARHA